MSLVVWPGTAATESIRGITSNDWHWWSCSLTVRPIHMHICCHQAPECAILTGSWLLQEPSCEGNINVETTLMQRSIYNHPESNIGQGCEWHRKKTIISWVSWAYLSLIKPWPMCFRVDLNSAVPTHQSLWRINALHNNYYGPQIVFWPNRQCSPAARIAGHVAAVAFASVGSFKTDLHGLACRDLYSVPHDKW